MIGISIVSVIVLLGILIFAHEFGHFLMAKYSRVGVLKFSLGFGPRLVGKKVGETEYLVSLVPLGGYVKLLGESDTGELSEEDMKRSFLAQSVYKRIAIVAAGPIFNFLLAILIFAVVNMWGVPKLTTKIGGVYPESAAFEAGMQGGDVIVAIDGKEISRWDKLAETVTDGRGKELRITVKREGQVKDFLLTPRLIKSRNIFGEEVDAYKIGVTPSYETVVERMNPLSALWSALKQTWVISKLTVISIIKILEGVISPRTLGGPILIAQIAGAQVKEGIIPFVLFMALLSINLAVLNLLPIPILDGGHLLFYFIEVIIGREINVKWREMAQQVGFVLLIILMIFVFIMDIERLNIKAFDDFHKAFTR